MAYLVLTCPESAHLEMIEYEPDPLGLLVSACSRFRPPNCIDCTRTCAARLDKRDLGAVRALDAEETIADPTIVDVVKVA